MPRSWGRLVLLVAAAAIAACAADESPTDNGHRLDADGESLEAADSPPADVGPEADAPSTDDAAPGDGEPPVDCAPIAAVHELCASSIDRCEAVFADGAGCAAVCALAGLPCLESHEDVDGACAADTTRPALGCADTGHGSDYCVCGRSGSCTPSCDGRDCGSDGCGGSCGECGTGEHCDSGACVPDAVDCSTYPRPADELLGELVGFGGRTTGGDPANVYRVTTDAASGAGSLRAGLESDEDYWIVFDIGVADEATIDLDTTSIRIRSNKTVDGRMRRILVNGALELRDARNVILSDLRLMNDNFEPCTQDGDVVSIRSAGGATPAEFPSRDIWLHHLELFLGGDGLFDVRGGSRITVSWTHFHSHAKGMLVGMESAPPLEGTEMEITFHHNFLDRLSRRGPQVSVGRAHFFNNYQFEWWEFGAASLAGAQFLSEHNVYQARPGATCGLPFIGCEDPNPCGDSDYVVSKVALSIDWATDNHGYTRSTGDLALAGAELAVHEPTRVFTPDYAYELEPATEELAERVRAGAGPRTTCP
jgi:pectate lyase